jgi:hypothetical protein
VGRKRRKDTDRDTEASGFLVDKEVLVSALTTLGVIPEQIGTKCSEYIRIEHRPNLLRFELAAGSVSGCVQVPGTGVWSAPSPYYVHRRALIPFVSGGKSVDKRFQFTRHGKGLMMRHGRRRLMCARLPHISGYVEVRTPTKPRQLEIKEEQRVVVHCAELCACSDAVSPHLNCVYVSEDGWVMAADQSVVFAEKTEPFNVTTPIPLYIVKLLGVEGKGKEIVFGEDSVLLRMGNVEFMQMVSKSAAAKFPFGKISVLLQAATIHSVVMTTEAVVMAGLLERFSKAMSLVRRSEREIQLTVTEGKKTMVAEARVPHVRLHEVVPLAGLANTSAEITFVVDTALPVMRYLANKKQLVMLRAAGDSPYFFSSEETQLVLARRIQ